MENLIIYAITGFVVATIITIFQVIKGFFSSDESSSEEVKKIDPGKNRIFPEDADRTDDSP